MDFAGLEDPNQAIHDRASANIEVARVIDAEVLAADLHHPADVAATHGLSVAGCEVKAD